MTVSQVFGCGTQKGRKEFFRGHEYEVNLVPKIKVGTVMCEILVEKVLEVAQKVLRTGKFGDEKIFVYELSGAEAIMDTPGEKL